MSSVDRSFSAAMQSHLGFSLYLILTKFSGAYATEESKVVNDKPGRNVTLECVVPTQDPIEVLKWIRPDLKAEGFVLFYRDKVIKPTYQHPSYVSRVELRDPEMKHGDVSLILMNSNVNDSGRYEGHVSLSGVGRRRRAQSELRCVISLSIRDSGDAHENTLNRLMGENLIVYSVVAVFSLIFLAGTSYAVIRRCRHQQRLENCQVLEMDDQLFQRVEIENSL